MAYELKDIDFVAVDGKPLPARIVNSLIEGHNETNAWIRNYMADHPDGADISQAKVIGLKSNYEYEGEPITPTITLWFAGKQLKANEHFLVEYKNNNKIGQAKIKCYGLEPYYGELEAAFQIDGKKYNLTYESAHGSTPSARMVSTLGTNDLPNLEDEDYRFDGWFDANGKAWSVGETIYEDTRLIAHWTAKTFTLTYETEHGTVAQPTSKLSAVPKLPEPKEEGFKLLGWYYEDGTKAQMGDSLHADTTLTAKWISTEVLCDVIIDKTTKAVSYAIEAEEKVEPVTLEYSNDNGTTWQPYSETMELNESISLIARVMYMGGAINEFPSITMTLDYDDGDFGSISFSSAKGTVTTLDGEDVGTIDVATFTGTKNVTDGTSKASVTITND